MNALTIFLLLYFGIGFIYALYFLLFTPVLWYVFPINVIFGVPGLIANIYTALTRPKRLF